MPDEEYIEFNGTFVDLKVDFDEDISARVGYHPRTDGFSADISQGRKTLFGKTSNRYCYPALFEELHEKLDERGLEGFPEDPDYVLDRLKNPPAQFKDMGPNGMTDEEYLATLDENGNPR